MTDKRVAAAEAKAAEGGEASAASDAKNEAASDPYLSQEECSCGSLWEVVVFEKGRSVGYCDDCGIEKWKELNPVVNLTQHPGTLEQIGDGVFDLQPPLRKLLQERLTFTELPSPKEIRERAEQIADMAVCTCGFCLLCKSGRRGAHSAAMIGGAPYLMAPLEQALRARKVEPLYAFSKRESVEEKLPDGSVRKTQVFRHSGFVRAADVVM